MDKDMVKCKSKEERTLELVREFGNTRYQDYTLQRICLSSTLMESVPCWIFKCRLNTKVVTIE